MSEFSALETSQVVLGLLIPHDVPTQVRWHETTLTKWQDERSTQRCGRHYDQDFSGNASRFKGGSPALVRHRRRNVELKK